MKTRFVLVRVRHETVSAEEAKELIREMLSRELDKTEDSDWWNSEKPTFGAGVFGEKVTEI